MSKFSGYILTLCQRDVLLLLLSKVDVPNISFKSGKTVKLTSSDMCCANLQSCIFHEHY